MLDGHMNRVIEGVYAYTRDLRESPQVTKATRHCGS